MNKTILWILAIALVAGLAVVLMIPRETPLTTETMVTGLPDETAPSAPAETVPQPTPELPPEPAEMPQTASATAPTETQTASTGTGEQAAVTETQPVDAGPVETTSDSIDGRVDAGEYSGNVEAGGVQMYWANDADILRVALVSPGTGYVAVGFDPDRGMDGANFILGAVTDGATVSRDDVGTSAFTHAADTSRGGTDDLVAARAAEREGSTTFEFAIPLDSGDPQDRPLSPGATYTVLLSYQSASDRFETKHTQRGSAEITLDPAS